MARKYGIRKVEMSQTLKVANLRRNSGEIEVIVSEVQPPEIGQKKQGTVGKKVAKKPAGSKVQANHMAFVFVTLDPIPIATMLILLPAGCFRIRRIIGRSRFFKRNRPIKMEKSRARLH